MFSPKAGEQEGAGWNWQDREARAGQPPQGAGAQPGGLQPVARAAAGRGLTPGLPPPEAKPGSTLGPQRADHIWALRRAPRQEQTKGTGCDFCQAPMGGSHAIGRQLSPQSYASRTRGPF